MDKYLRAITWLMQAAAFMLLLQANAFLYWETKTAKADYIDGEFWRDRARGPIPCDTDADCEMKNPHLVDPERPFYEDEDRPFKPLNLSNEETIL